MKKYNFYKKVLLHQCKRHTAHHVAVASACYSGGVPRVPPWTWDRLRPWTWDGVPPQTWDGVPPTWTWDGVPPYLDLGWGTPLPRTEMGYPPTQT